MNKQRDTADFIRAQNEVLLKPIWDYLANPHPGNPRENALNGGVRLVDHDKQPDMIRTLMQGVESGHVFHAGNIALSTEKHIYHLPAFNGAAALVAGIVSQELKGYALNEGDIRTKSIMIEQPVPPDNDEPALKPSLQPHYLKPPIDMLLKEGKEVPEIDMLLSDRIMMIRPITPSSSIKLPASLTEAARLGKISITPAVAHNFIDVFSTPARKSEAMELLGIANRRTGHTVDQGAQRIAEIIGMDYTP